VFIWLFPQVTMFQNFADDIVFLDK
jgi:hypothetical protein